MRRAQRTGSLPALTVRAKAHPHPPIRSIPLLPPPLYNIIIEQPASVSAPHSFDRFQRLFSIYFVYSLCCHSLPSGYGFLRRQTFLIYNINKPDFTILTYTSTNRNFPVSSLDIRTWLGKHYINNEFIFQ